jgi:hypothetical protein
MPTLPTQATQIQTDGTHLQGQVEATYRRLVAALGPATHLGANDLPEWHIQWGFVVVTIYLHKFQGRAEDATLWNIGGYDSRSVELVRRLVSRPTWHLPSNSPERPKLRRLLDNGDRLSQWGEWS